MVEKKGVRGMEIRIGDEIVVRETGKVTKIIESEAGKRFLVWNGTKEASLFVPESSILENVTRMLSPGVGNAGGGDTYEFTDRKE